jgi:DNA (cytosine-5)-methyltransferase 1
LPRLLDLFCGAGGAATGYARAGFEVVGVDICAQPNFPFKFYRRDALDWLGLHGWDGFDAIHASPPCQAHSAVTPDKTIHENLIPPTRDLLEQAGLPYVIENVEGARGELHDPVMLCGSMFDPILGVRRHRLFETNWGLEPPAWPCRHDLSEPRFDVYEHGKWRRARFAPVYGSGGRKAKEHWAEAMGIDWMSNDEMALAIPPAYTEYIGHQLQTFIRINEQSSNETAA